MVAMALEAHAHPLFLGDDDAALAPGPSEPMLQARFAPPEPEPASAAPKYVPAAPFSATRLDGTSVMIPRRKRVSAWRPSSAPRGARLLAEPLDELMERARAPAPVRPRRACAPARDTRMWVEKYQPRTFIDLLGDDRLHRETLRWLKAWDPCVFGREAPPPPPPRSAWHDERAPDKYGRPHERVLLMSGPPGLGKTTLSHVVAHHAGYRVYELNASDARTAADVEQRVRTALESDSLRGSGRPTLVVIDEIDGAMGGSEALGTAGFVRALVRLLERGAGHGKKAKPLVRPIVCICNDLYAPALRPLRPLAKIVRFHRAPTPMITRRLREICAHEHLGADARGLTMLCEATQGDLRACLHTLELVHRSGAHVDEHSIQHASLGVKDSAVPLQHMWAKLFCGVESADVARHSSRVHALVHDVTAFGDYDRLVQGCFEHYVHLRVPDQGWGRYADALDWLDFAQRTMHGAWGSGSVSFELLPYVPWAFVAWHALFANRANRIPEQPPRADFEWHMQRKATDETLDALMAALPPSLRPHYSRGAVACELAPLLARILSPDIKAGATQPPAMHALVDTMLLYGMSFEPDRNEAGALVYRLHPSLDVFAQCGSRGDVGPTRHGARQHVQRELDAERRRRRAAAHAGTTASQAPAVPAPMPTPVPAPAPTYRDFFGRVLPTPDVAPSQAARPTGLRVFFRYHEGYSNAVRKPIKLAALL